MFRKLFKYHKTLVPKIWDNDNEINQLVAQSLRMMAFEYVRYLGTVLGLPITSRDVIDICVHGSIANYYWDKHSDIDLCVVTDLSKLREKLPDLNHFLFFNATQQAWHAIFRAKIFGRTVDIFIFDAPRFQREIKTSNDTFYSLLLDKWIVAPKRIPDKDVKQMKRMTYKRYRVIVRQCKYMIRNKMAHEFIDTYISTMKTIRRRSVLEPHGHAITSAQMAYKMAKNKGVLLKLRRASQKQLSRRYTLK